MVACTAKEKSQRPESVKISFVQWMEVGQTGVLGKNVQKHVEVVKKQEQGHVVFLQAKKEGSHVWEKLLIL